MIDFRSTNSAPGLREWRAMASRGTSKGRRKKDRVPRRLFKERHEPPTPSGVQLVRNPAGHEKMSDVLKEFVEPFRDLVNGKEALSKLLTLAVLAWNAAILPEDQGQAMIDEMLGSALAKASREDRAQAREIVEMLVRRKQEHFAANQRMIVSFELTDTGDGFHLDVMYTL